MKTLAKLELSIDGKAQSLDYIQPTVMRHPQQLCGELLLVSPLAAPVF